MSEETNEIIHDEAERPTLSRAFEGVEIAADGRNVEMLCAPFDIPTTVVDPPPFGNGEPYEEEFARGAFAGAVKAPNRVLLEFEHWSPGISGVLGHAAQLEERADALYGRFRMTEHPDGDKALALIRDGVLTAASVFFQPIRSTMTRAGRMRRTRVRLDRVSLCRVGAYPQAKVLAVRSASVEPVELPELAAFNPDLAEYLSAQGIVVPARLRGAKE